jgi:hypothetical protein
LLLAAVFLGVAGLASPASANVTGDCRAEDNFAIIEGTRYTPDNDTPFNPVVLPDADGVIVPYEGKTLVPIESHSGRLTMPIGPAPIVVGRPWSHANTGKDLGAGGSYPLDHFYDQLPFDLAGLYRIDGTHNGKGGSCSGFALVRFENTPFTTPVGLASFGGLGLVLILILVAAFGHHILGASSGLFFGLFAAVALQQSGYSLLDNFALFGLPVAFLLFGSWLGSAHPFGGLGPDDLLDAYDDGPPWYARPRLFLGYGPHAGETGMLAGMGGWGSTLLLMGGGLAFALVFGALRHLEYGFGEGLGLAFRDPVVWLLALTFGLLYPLLRLRAVGRWSEVAL